LYFFINEGCSAVLVAVQADRTKLLRVVAGKTNNRETRNRPPAV